MGDDRPLILAGGPKAVYEPWDFFGLSPDGREGADVVVTGEEYVLLELLDRIVEMKRPGDTMLAAFERARDGGLLEDIPGLVYRPDAPDGPPPHLVNTGVQRLVQDLDELPLPLEAMGLFEPPHGRSTLSSQPVPAERTRSPRENPGDGHHPRLPVPLSLLSHPRLQPVHLPPPQSAADGRGDRRGCRTLRHDQVLWHGRQLLQPSRDSRSIARGHGTRQGREQTVPQSDYLCHGGYRVRRAEEPGPLALGPRCGLRGLWLGIEDLTAGLVKKGQTVEKTKTLFKLLVKQGIAPMPMMMHHDGQPLWTLRSLYGLLNQVRFLWRAGAASCQVTLLTPWVGSQGYEQPFRDGLVLSTVGGQPIEQYQYDGNHCLATSDAHPWRRQINMLVSYAAFYNPLNLLLALPRFDKVWRDRVVFQLLGMVGLAKSIYQSRGWLKRLIAGPIEKSAELPRSRFRMVAPQGMEICLTHEGGLHER